MRRGTSPDSDNDVVRRLPSIAPLSSARLKLERAREHLDVLTAEIDHFTASRPYEVVHEDDANTGEQLLYAVPVQRPDPALGLVLGDLVHDLSAALDHAIYGLSVTHAERPLSERARRSLGYPIHLDGHEFERQGRPKLRFLPAQLQAVIVADQPFQGPTDTARLNHPLEVLRELWNADKHRSLLLVTAQPELIGVGMRRDDQPHRLTAPHVALGTVVSRLLPADADDPREPYFEVRVLLAPSNGLHSPIAGVSSVESLALSLFRHVAFLLMQLGMGAYSTPWWDDSSSTPASPRSGG